MTETPDNSAPTEAVEPHKGSLGDRLNWLRAGVLGANDGLVSTAGIVVGMAGATSTLSNIVTAGLAGLVAGSLSMAGGEYVSVSTQRDTEAAALELEKWELKTMPEQELDELARLYEERGLSQGLARQVATELMQTDALRAHAEVELNIDSETLTNPWHAAGASFLAFAVGGAIPAVAILAPSDDYRIAICVVAVLIGLVLTGGVSARLGNAPAKPAIMRNVVMGALTMLLTWIVGKMTGGVIG